MNVEEEVADRGGCSYDYRACDLSGGPLTVLGIPLFWLPCGIGAAAIRIRGAFSHTCLVNVRDGDVDSALRGRPRDRLVIDVCHMNLADPTVRIGDLDIGSVMDEVLELLGLAGGRGEGSLPPSPACRRCATCGTRDETETGQQAGRSP